MKTLKSDDTPVQNDLLQSKERSGSVTSKVKPAVTPVVALKGSVFTLPVIKLGSFDIVEIRRGLADHMSSALDFFRHAPIVVDLAATHDVENNTAFAELSEVLKSFDLICVAVQHGTKEQQESATAQGFAVLSGQLKIHPKYPQVPESDTVDDKQQAKPRSNPVNSSAAEAKTGASGQVQTGATKIISSPIRSGQRVYARGCDLIVLAAVNAGAEIMADGNIHIYAPLRGRALAGVNGDLTARIFCHSFEAELVAIAGSYRVFEDVIPDDIYNKSVQIYLDGEQLKIEDIE